MTPVFMRDTMTQFSIQKLPAAAALALAVTLAAAGCHTNKCNTCDSGCGSSCDPCNSCDSGGCGWFGCGMGGGCCGHHWRSYAIPDTYPLGSVIRAHTHTMQTNAEAADFILHRHDFVGQTAELTPAGKDRIAEIAARARSAPFPVLVERTEHNSDPELDEHRRRIIAQVLHDFGIPEADQRTFVAPTYGKAHNSLEGEFDYYQFIFSRGNNGFNGNGGNSGFGGGGFGGGGGGFGGGGGGGF